MKGNIIKMNKKTRIIRFFNNSNDFYVLKFFNNTENDYRIRKLKNGIIDRKLFTTSPFSILPNTYGEYYFYKVRF